MSKLREHEINEVENIEEGGKERFKITDKGRLSWAMKKLKHLEDEKAETKDVVKDEIERLEEWLEAEEKRIDGKKDFFEGLIMEYLQEQKEKDEKLKTIKTPYGTLGYKKQQNKYHYDDKVLGSFLKENGYEDMYEPKPKKAVVKKSFGVHDGKLIDEDGQIVDGVEVEEMGETIFIKPE